MKNIQGEFNDVLSLATAGDAAYFVIVGRHYLNGDGVGKSYAEAHDWFLKGAAKDDSECQYELGMMNLKGLGIEKNSLKAKQLFLQSAENGSDDANYVLAALYFGNKSIYTGEKTSTQNPSRRFFFNLDQLDNQSTALSRLQSAAKAGHPKALAMLGVIYAEGDEIESDHDRALALLQDAANKGNAHAMISLSIIYRLGALGKEPNKSVVKHWTQEAAKTKDSMALHCLAGFFGEEGDLIKAKEVLEESIENGGHAAYVELAIRYLQGSFGEVDYQLVENYLLKASGMGDVRAKTYLAELYRMKTPLENQNLAMKWCQEAAEEGDPEAIIKLGIYYWKGVGCEVNLDKAIEIHKVALEKGHPEAARNLQKLEKISREVNKFRFMKEGKFNLKETFH